MIGIPHRQLCGLVGTPSAVAWAAAEHFAGPQRESIMSDPQRREFLAAAGIASLAALATAPPAAGGDPSFMNNVPDPTLAGKELPTFKFALEKSEGKVIGNSYGKEATVEQLPISKGIAGVSMRLEPGAMRELHWHATAAEWAFVLEGRVRTTVVDPGGLAETNDFDPGDVWYFPRGHGHMLQCLGDKPCHFILIFDNGYFSEFGTFSITDWIGHTPPALLAKNFGLPESAFATFPEGGSVFRARRTAACGAVGAAAGLEAAAGDPQVPPAGAAAACDLSGRPRVARRFQPLPDREDDHRRRARSRSRRAADAALASERRRVAVRHRGRGERHPVRLARPLPDRAIAEGRRRLHPARLRPLDRECRQRSCRILIGFNAGIYETIDLSQWIAANPKDVLATNFGQPAEVFGKFPDRDVFIAGKDGT